MDLINKHKGKLISALVIIAVLAAAWFWGGRYPRTAGASDPTEAVLALADAEPSAGESAETPDASPDVTAGTVTQPTETATTQTPEAPSAIAPGADESALSETAAPPADVSSDGVVAGNEDYSVQGGMEINPETGKDKYLTDPVPEGKPLPVEPQLAEISDAAYTCILSVRCDTILSNLSLLDREKHELVPGDGVIFEAAEVVFYEGESVFNVLQREMKRNKIHMEFVNTPIYNSAYIEGINNLYEFDVGELSGWMYKVNGWFPNYGCSRYQIQSGDIIEWVYTCDLGRDVGGYYAAGNRQ